MDIASNKITIAVISHSLCVEVNQNRWKKLAKDKKYDVHLIMPKHWRSVWLKDEIVYNNKSKQEDNFHIHAFATTNDKRWSNYLYKSLDLKFRSINPDIIYILHEEGVLAHQQVYLCKMLFARKAKIIFFSMNALGVPHTRTKNPVKKFIKYLQWQSVKINTEAALVHYPGCLNSLRDSGYKKPIFIQTQVGVDETLFRPSRIDRDSIRNKTGLENYIVIGYCGRLSKNKGVDALVDTFIKLSQNFDNIALMLVGNGDLLDQIKFKISESNLQQRCYITGFIEQQFVPQYMNAMDIFVLGSRTTDNWIDTFPLVTVQAQAVSLPVIASNSGSIPWQLGDTALIYEEANIEQLEGFLEKFIIDDNLRKEYSKKGMKRSLEYYCHEGMTKSFKKILDQIITGNYVFNNEIEYVQWKAC